jgi:hypothetical protein
MQFITPTEHEKSEWSRMACAAYAAHYNGVGHRYSGAAAIRKGERMALDKFDALQCAYRSWLCFNDLKAADYMVHGAEHRAHCTGRFAA